MMSVTNHPVTNDSWTRASVLKAAAPAVRPPCSRSTHRGRRSLQSSVRRWNSWQSRFPHDIVSVSFSCCEEANPVEALSLCCGCLRFGFGSGSGSGSLRSCRCFGSRSCSCSLRSGSGSGCCSLRSGSGCRGSRCCCFSCKCSSQGWRRSCPSC